jgi:hypothetical protein
MHIPRTHDLKRFERPGTLTVNDDHANLLPMQVTSTMGSEPLLLASPICSDSLPQSFKHTDGLSTSAE